MKSPRRELRRETQGFTLLELMISATVFLLVAGAVTTSIVVSSALNTTSRESALAAHAAQNLIEELKNVAFGEVYARYNATPDDDPAGGTSPGTGFAVTGLDPRADDADGFAGRIEFPGGGKELREDEDAPALGLPRDLNGDGAIDTLDHAADYRILPVRVAVEWTGQNGARTIELVTVLTEL